MDSDRHLIERFRDGDRSAFDHLVRRHYGRAYTLAYRMLGDADLAADAVQASFIRAYKGLASYRSSAAFTTWLYRIVVNVCLDLSRRRGRDHALPLTTDADEDAPAIEEHIADDDLGPEETLLRKERARAVQAALLHLPPHHRAVLVLYEIQGMAYEDIARVLSVPVGTVKSRLNRARAAFAASFSEYLELFEIRTGQTPGVDEDAPQAEP